MSKLWDQINALVEKDDEEDEKWLETRRKQQQQARYEAYRRGQDVDYQESDPPKPVEEG